MSIHLTTLMPMRALRLLRSISRIASGLVLAATAVSFLTLKYSWIRMWDFPRLQLAVAGTALLGFRSRGTRVGRLRGPTTPSYPNLDWPDRVLYGALLAAVAYQWLRVWRYTPAAPREVRTASRHVPSARLSIVEANVLLSNRDAERLLDTLRRVAADVIVCAETDQWWCTQLKTLAGEYPFHLFVPMDNTYGMALLSRLPLADSRIEFLTDPEVPSIHVKVQLRNGVWVSLHGLHPRPPTPDKTRTSLQRDSELLVLAKRVRDTDPVIVCGDMNDVAWSRTTRLFQKISQLLDPRKGRGIYATYNAFWPGLRFPLDHFYHSADFELVDLQVVGAVGSDHFPMYIVLQHSRSAETDQHAPEAAPEDWRRVRKTLSQARTRARS